MQRFEISGQGYKSAVAITESDTVDFAVCSAVYVGGTGTIVGIMETGVEVTFTGLLTGVIYPFKLKRVKVASTATLLVALY